MQDTGMPAAWRASDNHTYYFRIGRGRWTGAFSFHVTNWRDVWSEPIGAVNRILVISMFLVQRLLGTCVIDSEIEAAPTEGSAGVARNRVRIHRLGVTLYLLREEYWLNENGSDVQVRAVERFGPVPGLFSSSKTYPAVIHTGGLSSTYFMPLLGSQWIATYQVQADERHIDGLLKCNWAESRETIHAVTLQVVAG